MPTNCAIGGLNLKISDGNYVDADKITSKSH